MMKLVRFFSFVLVLGAFALMPSPASAQRDASFLAPSAVSSGGAARNDGSVGVEPKSEIDLGETAINVGKRTTLFFVNLTNLPIEIQSITANGDSNVDAAIVSDDCTKQGRIAPSSRCAVAVEVTPKGTGLWTAEVLMTHNGAGRLARAKLYGKTSSSSEKKDMGLALSTKNNKPIDFGDVIVGQGKAVRSALMVNDSSELITILSIEVIAPENGLERLEQGCLEDMDLKPGESCPVTLVWKPEEAGAISTDLIIRHSGRLGFAVIPVRGEAKEPKKTDKDGKELGTTKTGKGGDIVTPMPTAEELQRAMSDKLKPVSDSDLPVETDDLEKKEIVDKSDDLHLIGTVGNKALLYTPDGQTVIVGTGDETTLDNGQVIKVLRVTAKQAEILAEGKKKTLSLEAVSALTSKAAKARKDSKSKSSSSSKKLSPPKKKVPTLSKSNE